MYNSKLIQKIGDASKMKLLVVSDTHGNTEYLKTLVEKSKNKFDILIHLGDDSPDIDVIDRASFRIIKVPGVYEAVYALQGTKRRLIETFDGVKTLITHTVKRHSNDLPNEPGPEELVHQNNVDLVLYGHTHIPDIKKVDSVLYVNPGHLKETDKRGCEPSYALVECNKGTCARQSSIKVNIYNFITDKIIYG